MPMEGLSAVEPRNQKLHRLMKREMATIIHAASAKLVRCVATVRVVSTPMPARENHAETVSMMEIRTPSSVVPRRERSRRAAELHGGAQFAGDTEAAAILTDEAGLQHLQEAGERRVK